MILHPHWGYFCKFNKLEFSFQNIVDYYKSEFVSSHYRNLGRVNIFFNVLIKKNLTFFKLFFINFYFYLLCLKNLLLGPFIQ